MAPITEGEDMLPRHVWTGMTLAALLTIGAGLRAADDKAEGELKAVAQGTHGHLPSATAQGRLTPHEITVVDPEASLTRRHQDREADDAKGKTSGPQVRRRRNQDFRRETTSKGHRQVRADLMR